ncbi:MAG TPA: hypothetical protein VI703_06950 [Anaerolineales bacterium]|nr:hypothetical protein [Anaerolineales bacterium]
MRNFSSDVKITKVKDASAAGQTAVNSDAVDMAGYESVLFLVNAGAITATGVQSINAAESPTSGGTYTDLAGSKVPIADDDDNQAFWVEIKRPLQRFVRLEIARATADSAFGAIWAFQFGPSVKPQINNVVDAITGELWVSPAEGTA